MPALPPYIIEPINADLSGAVLRDAVLRDAVLPNTILRDADLTGADLTGAVALSDKQLNECRSLVDATMPDGSKHDW